MDFMLLLCVLLLLPVVGELRLSGFRALLPNPEPSGASLNSVEKLLTGAALCCWQLPRDLRSLLLLLLPPCFDWLKGPESKAGFAVGFKVPAPSAHPGSELLLRANANCMQLPPDDDSARVWCLGDTGGEPRTRYADALLLPPPLLLLLLLLLLLRSLLPASKLLALQLMRSFGAVPKIPASAAMVSAGMSSAERCGITSSLLDSRSLRRIE
jgi:hypothetical protein